MSIGDILTGIGTVGTIAGTATSQPYIAGAGMALGALGTLLGGEDKTVTQKTSYDDPTTPYRVKLPSGAVITMYAHGKGGSTTTTTTNNGTSFADAAFEGAKTYAKLDQDEKARVKAEQGKTAATTSAVTAADPNFLGYLPSEYVMQK